MGDGPFQATMFQHELDNHLGYIISIGQFPYWQEVLHEFTELGLIDLRQHCALEYCVGNACLSLSDPEIELGGLTLVC